MIVSNSILNVLSQNKYALATGAAVAVVGTAALLAANLNPLALITSHAFSQLQLRALQVSVGVVGGAVTVGLFKLAHTPKIARAEGPPEVELLDVTLPL